MSDSLLTRLSKKNAVIRSRLQWDWFWRSGALKRALQKPAATPAVIVSLTSYPPRFESLHLTLQSLLLQSVPGHKVMLWIAHGDMDKLPPQVRKLEQYGLDIRACDDLKSYKKLIPLLAQDCDVPVVTADDDVYYWPNWLRELVDARQAGRAEVLCHRMHRMKLDGSGLPLPYNEWQHDARVHDPDVLHFPTGIGGVLYVPGIFAGQVLDIDTFTELCPRGDDIWFYWMARTNGARFRRVESKGYLHCWKGSQDAALWKNNMLEEFNDVQIRAMIGRFGFFGKSFDRSSSNS